jgi:hypothetical protein
MQYCQIAKKNILPMRPHPLALVLIKVLGISTVVDGFCHLSTVLALLLTPLYLAAQGLPLTTVKSRVVIEGILQLSSLPVGLVSVALGLFLLLKADFIVKTVLKIDASNSEV